MKRYNVYSTVRLFFLLTAAQISFATAESSEKDGTGSPPKILHVGSHLNGQFVTEGEKWNPSYITNGIRFEYNPSGYPPGHDINKVEARINEAFSAWNDLSYSYFEFQPFSKLSDITNRGVAQDGHNVISWYFTVGGNVAEQFSYFDENGLKVESDIRFNRFYTWNFDSSPPDSRTLANVDFGDVLMHELGHTQGLGHATVNFVIMYSPYDEITAPIRVLADGDKAGGVYLHPVQDYSGALPHSIVLPGPYSGVYHDHYNITANVSISSGLIFGLEGGATLRIGPGAGIFAYGKVQIKGNYFNRIRPNAYQQNRTPYQRMKRAGISSKTAELACFWTVTLLDDPKYKNLNFILPQSVNHVPRLDMNSYF